MKKVKIMLTAITIFAVVGGALAFKAQKFYPARQLFTTDNPVEGATCPFVDQIQKTTDDIEANQVFKTWVQSAPCVVLYTTNIEL